MTTPGDPPTWRYVLTLDGLDEDLATFRYREAPLPQMDDTRLGLNRPTWEELGRPSRVHVTITAERAIVPPQDTRA